MTMITTMMMTMSTVDHDVYGIHDDRLNYGDFDDYDQHGEPDDPGNDNHEDHLDHLHHLDHLDLHTFPFLH